ncbi:hypothetical protein G7046_g9803 [Stylonectria norvegica]|nr:hypothetical protein G7046_g9803 [Stylonectria norvegica]
MTQARRSYGSALQLANAALCDAAQAARDTTMLAVLILGTYETISGRSPHTVRAWQDHVNGAAALASLRGSTQFRTRAGVRMFVMLSHSVLVSCIQSGLPMPAALVHLRAELPASHEVDSPAWRFLDPMCRALQVRYDIKVGRLNDVNEIVTKLSDIDDEFATLLSELPKSWNYHRVQLARPDPRVLGSCCHVYPGLVQVTTWNEVRAIRILVLETLLEQILSGPRATAVGSLPHHHQTLLSRTVQLIKMLGQAIVASVPQHFGVVSFRGVRSPDTTEKSVLVSTQNQPCPIVSQSMTPDELLERHPGSLDGSRATSLDGPPPSDRQEDEAERFMTLASASNTIIWPLYILGMSPSCSLETKEYAIGRLHAIHRETGLEQARVVASMLQDKAGSPPRGAILLPEAPQIPMNALADIV